MPPTAPPATRLLSFVSENTIGTDTEAPTGLSMSQDEKDLHETELPQSHADRVPDAMDSMRSTLAASACAPFSSEKQTSQVTLSRHSLTTAEIASTKQSPQEGEGIVRKLLADFGLEEEAHAEHAAIIATFQEVGKLPDSPTEAQFLQTASACQIVLTGCKNRRHVSVFPR